jgi:hypothetical protein
MDQSQEEMPQNLAERGCWPAARRDDVRVARRLDPQQVGDGVYRLDDGAWLADCFPGLHELGVADGRTDVQGTTIQRVMVPFVHEMRRYRLQTLCGLARMKALPARLCSDAALLRRVGFKAQPVRPGVCPRGAATRQGPRPTGPIYPDAWAAHIVKLSWRDLEAMCTGVREALATTGGWTAKRTGLVEATELETTAPEEGGGPVTRQRPMPDTRGTGHAREVTVEGWPRSVWRAAPPPIPWAATVVPSHAPATRAWRALVPPARRHLAGQARRHTVVVDRGC